jgi:hypothetical protein
MREVSKSEAIPVTGCGGLLRCDVSRIPHYLDNRFTFGGEVSDVAATLYPPGRFLVLISVRG